MAVCMIIHVWTRLKIHENKQHTKAMKATTKSESKQVKKQRRLEVLTELPLYAHTYICKCVCVYECVLLFCFKVQKVAFYMNSHILLL